MKWRFVFRYGWSVFEGRRPTLDDVKNFAIMTGYKFFAFNGVVYFVTESLTAEDTGITTKDLI